MSGPVRHGAVAAGDPATAAAAQEILADGGTAFDAALAALAAACIAEPVLASLGGGGFLLACPADGHDVLYDFFVHTPRRMRSVAATDFRRVTCDFGPATQDFHIGLGAAATPGTVSGLFAVHRDLGSLPMARIVEPAARLARQGVRVSAVQAFVGRVVGPILLDTAGAARHFGSAEAPGTLAREGEIRRWPALADTLEALAAEGADLFYRGAIARRIAALSREGGGHLALDDLAGYRTLRRTPLERHHHGARVLTNPPPSAGGVLIAFSLALLESAALAPDDGFGSAGHVAALVEALRRTDLARIDAALAEAPGNAAQRLFDPELLRRYRAEVEPVPRAARGTTHVSVIDDLGNAASLTLTNGEGCGAMGDDDGFMLNNMLGEEDLQPRGFHAWPPDTRLSSMMAPTLVIEPDGALLALGSGGSNRIRSAILQVLVNRLTFGMDLEAAVTAPRLHVEAGRADLEPGFGDAAALAAESHVMEVRRWPVANLFFGGVHAVRRGADGRIEGAGDPRRGGAVATV